jgi:hemolysin activation/secretion protein
LAALIQATCLAYGQTPPNVAIPQNLQPGVIQKHSLESVPEPANQPILAPDPKQQTDIDAAPIEFNPNEPSPSTTERAVPIDTITLEGATQLSLPSVLAIIAPYQHRRLTFGQIQDLCHELTQLYITQGYINSRVYVPPQTFDSPSGEHPLVLKALEATLETVTLEGNRWFSAHAIRSRLSRRPGQVFNIHPLQRDLQLLNQHPDLNVKALLRPGSSPGSTNLLLQATDSQPYHLTAVYDNLGRSSIGDQRLGVNGAFSNFSGLGDTANTNTTWNRRSFGASAQYALPLAAVWQRLGPTELGLNYNFSNVALGGRFEKLKIRSGAHIYSASLRRPFWVRPNGQAWAGFAADGKDLKTDILALPLYRDRLRLIRPFASLDWRDNWGRTLADQEVALGLDWLGATAGDRPNASKPGSGSKFLRLTGGITRVQRMPWQTTALIRARYQWSPDRLMSAEQMQLGGAYTVRGYPEGKFIGDSGYTLTAEWYWPLPFLPATKPTKSANFTWRDTVQVVPFVDGGQIFTHAPTPQALGGHELRNETLLSTGLGLRVRLTRLLSARLDAGVPLLKHGEVNNSFRFHFGLQSQCF